MTAHTETPMARMLPDGRRLNLRNGPIDLIIEAMGAPEEVARAYQQASAVFPEILGDLAAELHELRRPIGEAAARSSHPIARDMMQVASGLSDMGFLTPMICVAGAVADYMLAAMCKGRSLTRAYVNNGGDIALYLAPGHCFDVGVCANPLDGSIASTVRITADDRIKGIATSGWRGRSHSLGIADAVTALGSTAAQADAAATLVANAVDLPGHPAIARTAANALSPDSDLGARLVTTQVGVLSASDIAQALCAGRRCADSLISGCHAIACYGSLQGTSFATCDVDHVTVPFLPSSKTEHVSYA